MSLDNPAGRLHALLSQAGIPSKKQDTTPARNRWAEVLGADPDDRSMLLARLSEVISLPSQVRAAVNSIPGIDSERYLKRLPTVEKSFEKLNLDTQWHSFAQHIGESAMDGLDVCDELLSRERPDPALPKDERARIHSEVRELFEEVLANETDPNLREFLLRHLKAMDDALQEYEISGTRPVEETIHAAVGDSFFRFLRGETLPRNSRWDRFWLAAHRLSIALHIATASIALPQAVSSMEQSVVIIELEEQAEDTQVESGGQPESEDEED